MTTLHVSDALPQLAPSWVQVLGAQVWVPHLFAPAPPHI
jgi:hypothetical protein